MRWGGRWSFATLWPTYRACWWGGRVFKANILEAWLMRGDGRALSPAMAQAALGAARWSPLTRSEAHFIPAFLSSCNLRRPLAFPSKSQSLERDCGFAAAPMIFSFLTVQGRVRPIRKAKLLSEGASHLLFLLLSESQGRTFSNPNLGDRTMDQVHTHSRKRWRDASRPGAG